MKPLQVALDHSSAWLGGGVAYATKLAPRLALQHGVRVRAVLASPEACTFLGESLEGDFVEAGHRRATMGREWPPVVTHAKVYGIYVLTEISFARYTCPFVVVARTPVLDAFNKSEFPIRGRARFRSQRELAKRSVRRPRGCIGVRGYAARLAQDGLARKRPALLYHGANARRTGSAELAPREASLPLLVCNLVPYEGLHRLLVTLARIDRPWRVRVVGQFAASSYRRRDEACDVSIPNA